MEEAVPMEFASLLTNNRDQMIMTQLREIQLMMIQLQIGYNKLKDTIQDVLDTVTNRHDRRFIKQYFLRQKQYFFGRSSYFFNVPM